jgi:hypothetical protein
LVKGESPASDFSRSKGDDVDDDLVERLEREWQTLATGALARELRCWARREPALAGIANPAELRRKLHGLRGKHEQENQILAALLRLGQSDPLAARVVLQVLLPGLKNLASRILFEAEERATVWSLLLGHAWEQIRCYPLARRPRRIAANLLLDTLKATTAELKAERRTREQLQLDLAAADAAAVTVESDVERLLADAVAAGVVSEQEAELILETRIDGVELRAVAVRERVAYHTLNVRRLRAERRLLLFLGYPVVTFGRADRPLSSARAFGGRLTG